MGLYFRTIFVPSVKNMENYTVLQPARRMYVRQRACWSVAKPDSIIDDNDTIQGFIDKKQLLSYYGHIVNDTQCTEDSFLHSRRATGPKLSRSVIEYIQSTVSECNSTLVESKRLPVV
jgi:hypothetical protein